MNLIKVKSVGTKVIARDGNILYVFNSLDDLKHYKYSDLYKIKTKQPVMKIEQYSDLSVPENLSKEVSEIEKRIKTMEVKSGS